MASPIVQTPQTFKGSFIDRSATRRFLSGDEAYGTTLLVIALDQFGWTGLGVDDPKEDAEGWAPSTLRRELEGEFNVKIPEDTFSRLMSAVAVVTTDRFYVHARDFVMMVNDLAFSPHDHEVFDVADVAECSWAIAEAVSLLDPQPTDDWSSLFSTEIKLYCLERLRREGFAFPPLPIKRVLGPSLLSRLYDPTIASDDPILAEELWQVQHAKADEVDEMVSENMQELFGQLSQLKLRNGSTAGLLASIASQ